MRFDPTRVHRAARFSALLVTALFVLFATARLGRSFWSAPPVSLTSEKFALFERYRDDVNLLFFGSSRVHHHVSPRLFDQMLRRAGLPARSLNLGVPAMRFFEMRRFIDQVLEAEPAKLRVAVVDPSSLFAMLAPENTRSAREIAWHDAESTLLALRSVACCHPRPGLSPRLPLYLRHLEAFSFHQLGIGAVAHRFERGRERQQQRFEQVATGAEDDGFEPFIVGNEEDGAKPGRRRAEFLAALGKYRHTVRQLGRAGGEERPLHAFEAEMLDELRRRLAARGVALVMILPPETEERRAEIHEAHRRGLVPVLFAFNDPLRHPALYAVGMRYDWGHLNRRGAEHFTRLLARRFIAAWRGGDIILPKNGENPTPL